MFDWWLRQVKGHQTAKHKHAGRVGKKIWPIATCVNSYFHHVLQFINQHKEHHIWPINGERSRRCVRQPDERKKKTKDRKKRQSQKPLKPENKIIMDLHTGEFLSLRTRTNSKPRKSIIHNFRIIQNLKEWQFYSIISHAIRKLLYGASKLSSFPALFCSLHLTTKVMTSSAQINRYKYTTCKPYLEVPVGDRWRACAVTMSLLRKVILTSLHCSNE